MNKYKPLVTFDEVIDIAEKYITSFMNANELDVWEKSNPENRIQWFSTSLEKLAPFRAGAEFMIWKYEHELQSIHTKLEAAEEVLKFYADPNNHITSDGRPPTIGYTEVGDDCGDKAYKVLNKYFKGE